jgi:hypothetical protein
MAALSGGPASQFDPFPLGYAIASAKNPGHVGGSAPMSVETRSGTLLQKEKPMRIVVRVMAALALLAVLTAPAQAQILGSQVSGQMLVSGLPPNMFDPASTAFVPSGYGNSAPNGPNNVVITLAGIEFGYDDPGLRVTADFNGPTLVLTEVKTGTGPVAALTFNFTDAAFAGYGLEKFGDTFAGSTITGALAGNMITITQAQYSATGGGTYQATFQLSSVPEPGTLTLAGLGGVVMLGVAALRRARALRA